MKLMDVTEKRIGEHDFYLRRFPAFVAANLSGELAALLTPMIGAFAPLAGNVSDDFNLADVDLEKAGPALAEAVSGLNGVKIETLMRKLLLENRNVSVSGPATDGEVKILDMDIANEVFCGELLDMYILCFEVIKLNFSGFFRKLGIRFGNLPAAFQTVMKSTGDSENSTGKGTRNSN